MKKLISVLAVIAAFSWATPGFARPDEGNKPGMGPGMHGGMELTADQQAKMKELAEGQKKGMEPLMDALKIKIDELRLLVDKKAPDDQLVAKIAEVAQAREALQQANKKWMDKRAEVLTPRQRAEMIIRMEGNRGKGFREGKGPRQDGRHGDGNAPEGNPSPEGKPPKK